MRTWETDFPSETRSSGGFIDADVSAVDLIGPVFEQLPQSPLANIAIATSDESVGRAAVEKVTNQAQLAKIAVEGKAWTVRCAAVARLADEALLAKIASEDECEDVRHAAAEKLTTLAFAAVPKEHRGRLIEAVLPAVDVFCDPDVMNHVGQIRSINTLWRGEGCSDKTWSRKFCKTFSHRSRASCSFAARRPH